MDTEKAESLLKEGGRTVIEYNNNNNSSSNTEGAEDAAEEKEEPSFSEWQIRLGGNAAFDSRHYRGCDFRNHDTGESILPAEVYMNLFQQVGALKSRAQGKIHCLLLVLYLAVIISPLVILNAIIDDDSANDNALTGIAVAITVMAVAFAIGKPCTNRIYKTLDSQAQALVDERRDEFLETYGIDLGYQCHNLEKNRLFNDNSHVWLRRPHQEEEEEAPAEGAATALSSSVAPPEEFPPIYLTPLVPGDIHILEARYHSSIGLDKKTWTLIQNTHKETMQKVNPTMIRVALLFSFLMIPYAVLAPVIGSYIGVGGYWCGLFLYFGVMYVLSRIVTRQYLQAQKQVAETVTRILLLNNDNEEEQQDDIKGEVVAHVATAPADGYAFSPTNNLAGCYSLLFLESPVEGRLTSTRYQLVRTRTRPTSEDDEKTVVTSTTMDEEDQATSSLEIV